MAFGITTFFIYLFFEEEVFEHVIQLFLWGKSLYIIYAQNPENYICFLIVSDIPPTMVAYSKWTVNRQSQIRFTVR